MQERSKRRNRQLPDSSIRVPSSASSYFSDLSFRHRILAVFNQRTLYGFLAFGAVIAPIILIILIVVGAAVTSGYNHLSDPISQLAAVGSPHPAWMTTGFFTYGVMILGFGVVLYRSAGNHCFAWLVLLFLILHGAGFLLGGVFRDDIRTAESASTVSGILHNIWIIVGCSSFVAGMFTFAWLKRNDPTWQLIARIYMVFLVIILLTFTVSQIPALADAEGVLQRTYGILSIILIEAAAIKYLVSLRRRGTGSVRELP